MSRLFTVKMLAGLVFVATQYGCAHQTPTIAHTHIGHAITAFEGTPGDQGLFAIAKERRDEAKFYLSNLRSSSDQQQRARALDALLLTLVGENYGLKRAISETANHLKFAAEAEDASSNVTNGIGTLVQGTTAIVRRCDLIALLGQDLATTSSVTESAVLIDRIGSLIAAIDRGEDIDKNNIVGNEPEELGLVQMGDQLTALIAGETPPYTTVDRWYLFHLVRLPECSNCWAWRKWGDSSNRGY